MEKYFEVVKGEDKVIMVRLIDDITGDPIDLTGKTLTGVLHACPTNLNILTENIEVLSSPLIGKVEVTFPKEQTALLESGSGSFEIVIDEGAGRIIKQFRNVLDVRDRI